MGRQPPVFEAVALRTGGLTPPARLSEQTFKPLECTNVTHPFGTVNEAERWRFISAPDPETDHRETRHRRAVTRPRSGGGPAPGGPRSDADESGRKAEAFEPPAGFGEVSLSRVGQGQVGPVGGVILELRLLRGGIPSFRRAIASSTRPARRSSPPSAFEKSKGGT